MDVATTKEVKGRPQFLHMGEKYLKDQRCLKYFTLNVDHAGIVRNKKFYVHTSTITQICK